MAYRVIGGKLVKYSNDKLHGKRYPSHIRTVESEEVRMRSKGQYGKRCNLTACQTPNAPAYWYNRGSYAFYCEECARMLSRVNRRDAYALLGEGNELCVYVPTAAEAAKLHVSR